MAVSTIRHDEVVPEKIRRAPVTVIGVGAIGSRVGASLIELGMQRVTFIDFDHIELHNLANQIFNYEDLGLSKVEGMMNFFKAKTGHDPDDEYVFLEAKLEKDTSVVRYVRGTVFLLVDSMEQRKTIVEDILENNVNVRTVIDVRMASTHGNVLTFDPHDPDEVQGWKDTLIDDDAAEVSACGTSLTVGPTAAIFANIAVWQMINSRQAAGAVSPKINGFLVPNIFASENLK